MKYKCINIHSVANAWQQSIIYIYIYIYISDLSFNIDMLIAQDIERSKKFQFFHISQRGKCWKEFTRIIIWYLLRWLHVCCIVSRCLWEERYLNIIGIMLLPIIYLITQLWWRRWTWRGWPLLGRLVMQPFPCFLDASCWNEFTRNIIRYLLGWLFVCCIMARFWWKDGYLNALGVMAW